MNDQVKQPAVTRKYRTQEGRKSWHGRGKDPRHGARGGAGDRKPEKPA